MIRNEVTPQHAVDLLNEAMRLDRAAVFALLNHRVPCNEQMAEHETIEVAQSTLGPYSRRFATYRVGMLGLLNGMFGGAIELVMQEDDPYFAVRSEA